MLLVASCTAPSSSHPTADGGAATPTAELSEPTDLTAAIGDGLIVRSTRADGSEDIETEIVDERSAETLAKAWYRADEQTWSYTLIEGMKPAVVQIESSAYEPSLAECNARLTAKWRPYTEPGFESVIEGDFIEYDDPGCDMVDFAILGNSHCSQDCCALHDQCYRLHSCSALSWILPDDGTCDVCNKMVLWCLGSCQISDASSAAMQLDPDTNRVVLVPNPCPTGQHRCYDVSCSAGRELYCRANCLTEPSPCETPAAGEVWCTDTCRNADGRMGFYAPSCTAAVSSCACDQDDLDRCRDSRCPAGAMGYCAESCDLGTDTPCCGNVNEPCCGNAAGCADRDFLACSSTGTCRDNVCGGSTQACCLEGPRCKDGFICGGSGNGTCRACGATGQPCCSSNMCSSGNVCQSQVCVTCGQPGQPCCPGTRCASGAVCSGNMCVTCGGTDEPCCGGSSCDVASLACVNGRCQRCGEVDQWCCADDECASSGLACASDNHCDTCGARGEICCDGNTCDSSSDVCLDGDCEARVRSLRITSVSPFPGCGQINFTIENDGNVPSGSFVVEVGRGNPDTWAEVPFSSLNPGARVSSSSIVPLDRCFCWRWCDSASTCAGCNPMVIVSFSGSSAEEDRMPVLDALVCGSGNCPP